MKSFFLVGNSEKDGIKKALFNLEKEIKSKGGVCYKSYGYIDTNDFPAVDSVITLGGDGTLIRAARDISWNTDNRHQYGAYGLSYKYQ